MYFFTDFSLINEWESEWFDIKCVTMNIDLAKPSLLCKLHTINKFIVFQEILTPLLCKRDN